MKLGDAGEAFFVQETDDSVPTSLATSPIPSSHQLETVVDDKKDNRKEDGRSEVQDEVINLFTPKFKKYNENLVVQSIFAWGSYENPSPSYSVM